ncbi:MAG: phytoene dehydrogenase [Gammaproteobacteria bacterium]|nr:phytoene dehydrogenase [Gammaproteobacteria bacterium]|tara:strand:- start:4577 stop:6145 length:1569 start_codon:yes stop_codon:yes gene_type:complete
MTKNNKKIVIIGGGHNALTCSAYLAKTGFAVEVYEARSKIGGMASVREFAEGYKAPGTAHLLHTLDANILKYLNLKKHGLEFAATGLKTISLNPNGDTLTIDGDHITGEGINLREQQEFKVFKKKVNKLARFFRSSYQHSPPRIGSGNKKDILGLMTLGWNLRSMGKEDMSDMLKFIAINIYDLLHEFFDDEFIKGSLAIDAVLGNHLGPRSNNTVITYLHQLTGEIEGVQGGYAIPKGGMDSYTNALKNSAEKQGVKIMVDSSVQAIRLDTSGKVCGITLENGDEVNADIVVSGIDPKSTFMCLVGPRNLEAGFVHKIQNIRMRGNASKLHLALSAIPKFNGVDANDLGERIIISPTMQYLEQAFDFTKYQACSDQLAMEITIPSIHDTTLAPEGHHVISAIVNYTPYALKEGWDKAKPLVLENIINTLNQYAPGIKEQILHAELLTPKDIESEYGITGGHWHHGELAFDQFLMLRPIPDLAQYSTPIESLYICGAGAHPGGGLMGIAGRNAAVELMMKES